MDIMIKKARASFPKLVEPEAFKDKNGSENKVQTRYYGIDILISKKDTETIKLVNDAVIAAAKEKFLDKAATQLKTIKQNPQRFCIVDGDEVLNKNGEPKQPGYIILSARRAEDVKKLNNNSPIVLDNVAGPDGKKPKVLEGADRARIYPGCYINAKVSIWGQNNSYGTGIRCNLLAVQFAKVGEAFAGGGPISTDDFESLVDETEMANAAADDFSDI